MHLFEVQIQNRVVKHRFPKKRIKGTQKEWCPEKLHFLAKSEVCCFTFVNTGLSWILNIIDKLAPG